MQSYQKNFFIAREKHFLLTLIFVKYNLFFFQIATRQGVFWTQQLSNLLSVLNLNKNLLIKNNITVITKACIYYASLLTLIYNSSVCIRRYFKLKGLGFSLRYLSLPRDFMLMTLGFSIPTYMVIPVYVSLVKRPKKKKTLFTVKSPEMYILSNFIAMLKKLKYPDPYKLKGIRYSGEFFNIKQGKKKYYMDKITLQEKDILKLINKIPAVKIKYANVMGKKIFHPRFISWS